ncbi:MAG: TlpA disulfide reductase family protein [Chitinophagaceae bacterium]
MKYLKILGLLLIVGISARAQEVKKISASDLGKILKRNDAIYVVNLWATWCKPCVEEMPYIQKIAEEYKNKNVKVILVSLDYDNAFPKKIESFAKKHGITSPIYWLDETDPSTIAKVVDKSWKGLIPCTILVNNKKGYRKFVAQKMDENTWEKEVKLAL